MNLKAKSLTVFLATALLFGGAGLLAMVNTDEAYAAENHVIYELVNTKPHHVYHFVEGDSFVIRFEDDPNSGAWVHYFAGHPSWTTMTYQWETPPAWEQISATNIPAGTYEFKIYFGDDIGEYSEWSDITLIIDPLPKLTIGYNAPSGDAVANKNWTYSPTTVPGVALTVTGVNWLSVNNGTIYGVPPEAGTYIITVKMSKDGYEDRTETFSLIVVSELIVLNTPSAGAIVFVR